MKIIFFTLNQKVMHIIVATDKLTSQKITSQLVGDTNVLLLLFFNGV